MRVSLVKKLFSIKVMSKMYEHLVEKHWLRIDLDIFNEEQKQTPDLQQEKGQINPNVNVNWVNKLLENFTFLRNDSTAQCMGILMILRGLFLEVLMHKGRSIS
jgi:hypothetical protein